MMTKPVIGKVILMTRAASQECGLGLSMGSGIPLMHTKKVNSFVDIYNRVSEKRQRKMTVVAKAEEVAKVPTLISLILRPSMGQTRN